MVSHDIARELARAEGFDLADESGFLFCKSTCFSSVLGLSKNHSANLFAANYPLYCAGPLVDPCGTCVSIVVGYRVISHVAVTSLELDCFGAPHSASSEA